MAINITDSFVRQYGDTVENVAQQQMSKLRAAVREQRVTGKDFTVERLQNPNDTLPRVTSRHADTSISDLTHSRRVADMISFARAYMIDTEDKIRMLVDPTNEYVTQMAGEMNRTLDDLIVEALLGSAKAGETGGSTVALPAGQQIVHGSTGLTLAKLKAAHKILLKNNVDVDREELYVVTNAEGYDDLASDAGLVSIDFSQYKPNMDYKVPVVAGFRIIVCERLTSYTGTSAASTNRPAIAFCKSALRLGIGADKTIRITQEALKNNEWLLSLKTTFGAVRAHDEKVVDIRFQE